MPIRYGRFEMPKTLGKEESTATDTYAKFIAEPFEAGYGHTVGNSLRRVLLSSLEGAAITAVKIAGAQHEFATLPGVVEDLTDIVLNLKKVKFKLDGQDHEPKKLSLVVNKEGEVTAGARRPRDLTSSDGDPGTNGVISKTRCGGLNKAWIRRFARSVRVHSGSIHFH